MSKNLTMTDFFYKEVRRTGNKAELIFDYVDGKPVRLMGFESEAWKSNGTICEEAFFYFKDLQIDSEEMRKERGC